MGLIPENIRYHTIDRVRAMEEFKYQLEEAQTFGGGGELAGMPSETKFERKARADAFERAAQPILNAASFHNAAHSEAERAELRLRNIEDTAASARNNVVLGDNAPEIIDAALNGVRLAHEQAVRNVANTNKALPLRLQSSAH